MRYYLGDRYAFGTTDPLNTYLKRLKRQVPIAITV